jgi:hypothetical protein
MVSTSIEAEQLTVASQWVPPARLLSLFGRPIPAATNRLGITSAHRHLCPPRSSKSDTPLWYPLWCRELWVSSVLAGYRSSEKLIWLPFSVRYIKSAQASCAVRQYTGCPTVLSYGGSCPLHHVKLDTPPVGPAVLSYAVSCPGLS